MTTATFVHAVGSHAAALLVIVAQSCVGARLLGWARMDEALSIHERLLFGWATGFAVTTAAWMLLVGTGGFGPVSVLAVLGGALLVSWPVPREIARRIAVVLRTADRPAQLAVAVGLLVLVLWAWPFWLETLLPNADWDAALYHLPLAERYQGGALWGRDPYFPAFSFPGAVHLCYAALMSLGLESAITPLNFQITLLCGVATVVLARRIGNRRSPIWAAVAFATTPILWQLGLDARIDSFLTFTIVLAVYAVVRFAQEGHDAHLALAALCLGGAIGCKYTALPFAAALGVVGLGFRLWGPRGRRGLGRLAALALLLIAIPNAAWYVANGVLHGDPLFPLLRGDYYVQADTGARVYLPRANQAIDPTRLEDPAVRATLRRLESIDTKAAPTHLFDFVDLLRNPDRYAVKPSHGMGPLLLLSLVLPLALPLAPEKRRGAILVWSLGWGAYVVLGSQTGLLRYALPALPLLAAATGLLISNLPWRALRIAIAVAALALFVRDHQAEQRKLELLRVDEVLRAEPSPWRDTAARIRWLEKVGFNFTPPMAYMSKEIARRVADGRMPADCSIWMVGEGKGRLLPCRYAPDASWFAHRFIGELENADLDPDRVARSLRRQGFTHVLYNRAYYDWVASDTDTSRARVAFALAHLERFLESHGTLLVEAGGLRLYALRPARGPR